MRKRRRREKESKKTKTERWTLQLIPSCELYTCIFHFPSMVCVFSSHSIVSLYPLYPFSRATTLLSFSPKLPLKTFWETQILSQFYSDCYLVSKKKKTKLSQEKNQMTMLMESHTRRLIATALEDLGEVMSNPQSAEETRVSSVCNAQTPWYL